MFVVMINPDSSLFSQLSSRGVAVFTLDLATAQTISNLDSFLQSYSVPKGTLVINQSQLNLTSNEYRVVTNFTPHSALIYACSLLGKPFANQQLVFRTTQGYSALGSSGYKAAANSTLLTTTNGIQKPARTSSQIAKAISSHPDRVWVTNTVLHSVEDTLVVEVEINNIKLNDAIKEFQKHSKLPVLSSTTIDHNPERTQLVAVKRYNSVVFMLVSSTNALSVDYILSQVS